MKARPSTLFVLALAATTSTVLAEDKTKLQLAIEKRNKLELEYKAAVKEVDEIAKADAIAAGEMPPEPTKPVTPDPEPEDPFVTESAIKDLSRSIEAMQNLKFELRQSVRDKTLKGLPATLQFTRYKDGKDAKVADVGLAVDYGCDDFAYGLLAEYHHATKTVKNKMGTDSLVVGPRVQWNGLSFMDTTQRMTASLLYKHDETVSGEGWVGEIALYPEIPQWNIFKDVKVAPGYLHVFLEPILGLQYEKGDGAKGFRDGKRISARAALNLSMTLFPQFLGNRLTLDNKVSFWEHLDTEGIYDLYDEGQWYTTSTLTYWFNTPSALNDTGILSPTEQHIGISAGLKWGDNADEGQIDTDTMTLGVSMKY